MRGFTLIEAIIVTALLSLLVSIASFALLRPQATASVEAVAGVLISDIKGQQLRAMVGDGGSQGPFGIHFTQDRYILFQGQQYEAFDPNNFAVVLDSGVRLIDITWPNGELIFAKRSGEVSDFTDEQNTTTVVHIGTGEQQTITINRFGAITIN